MAMRIGGFGGGGLNPFGSSLGGLSKYDIGADLADLEVYEVEVAWGNGLATDEAYIAVLTKALNATEPATQRRASAQNKLDDAVYRIGRSKAEEKGLDDLIAFDQAALAKMSPDNVRYRDVSDSLDAELAQRRSRDYGKLVLDYNAGRAATEDLSDWVSSVLLTIDEEDPDFDNWTNTQADLVTRLDAERDQKMYQDHQQGRIKDDAFVAYLTERRDSFEAGSPQYADWTDRLEDAQEQIKDRKQAATDQEVFNRYELGKISDATYLSYLRDRVAGMEPDDTDRPTWQHRINQASFSLAEDKLRFDVDKGRAPVSRLIAFYKSYRAGLNPGSAEWRQITRSLDALAGFGGGGGGGGGGRRGGGGGGGGGGGVGSATALPPKGITGINIEAALALMTVNPYAPARAQKDAKAFFELNYASLENARQRGDDVFLFFDPRKPGETVAARRPDGSPVLDAKGKPVMIRGSTYLPVSDDLFATLNGMEATYHFTLAEIELARHDPKGYADELRRGLEADDKARFVGNQAAAKAFDEFYEQAEAGIEMAMKIGDWALAINLSRDLGGRIAAELDGNPMLDDTRRGRLEGIGEKLADNPLMPSIDPFSGRQIGGAVNTAGSMKDGAGNFTYVALNAGWHHVLDVVDEKGAPAWGLKYDDVQDGSWEASHRKATTSYGPQFVTGEVSRRKAGTNPTVFVNYGEGMLQAPATAEMIAFTDENGQLVKAYSLDGKTWIRSKSGTAPTVEVTAPMTRRTTAQGDELIDPNGNVVFTADAAGGWAFVGDPRHLRWYGEAARDAASRTRRGGDEYQRLGSGLSGMGGPFGAFGGFFSAFGEGLVGIGMQPTDFGGPGQQMELILADVNGSLSFLSDGQVDAYEQSVLRERARNFEPFRAPREGTGYPTRGQFTPPRSPLAGHPTRGAFGLGGAVGLGPLAAPPPRMGTGHPTRGTFSVPPPPRDNAAQRPPPTRGGPPLRSVPLPPLPSLPPLPAPGGPPLRAVPLPPLPTPRDNTALTAKPKPKPKPVGGHPTRGTYKPKPKPKPKPAPAPKPGSGRAGSAV